MKRNRLIAIILCVIIFCSFPFSASAAVSKITSGILFVETSTGKGGGVVEGDFPLRIDLSDSKQKDITQVNIMSIAMPSFDGDSDFKVMIEFNAGSSFRTTSFSKCWVWLTDSQGVMFSSSVDYDYTQSTGTLILNFGCDKQPVGSVTLDVALYPSGTLSETANSNAFYRLTALEVDIQSETNGKLDSIINFFKELVQKLDNGIDSIGSWFSSLSNNIRNFFTNLINSIQIHFQNLTDNLLEFFENIKNWFTEIGDRIGDFFENLWSNITDTIDNITSKVSEWWQSVVEFFKSLFVPEDGFFEQYKSDWDEWARLHFGLFYDVHDYIDSMLEIFEDDTLSGQLNFPEIKLPKSFGGYVILDETTFNFEDVWTGRANLQFKQFYILFQMMVSIIAYGLLLKYLIDTFSMILANDKEAL